MEKQHPPKGSSAERETTVDAPREADAAAKRSRSTRDETTTRILDAAEELFSRRDPAKVTVREIAEKAGVTHPLVHQYVGSKAEVLRQVLERGAPKRQMIMTKNPDFREATPLIIADIMSRRVHSRSVLRAIMDGTDYADIEDRKNSSAMYLDLARASLDQGRRRSPAPEAMSPEVVLAAVVALAFGWTAGEDTLAEMFQMDAPKEQVREQLIDICVYLTELIYPPAEDTTEA